MAEKKNSAVRTVGLMMAITILGKVLGLVRDRLLSINYGTGWQASAFLMASRIPRVFFDAVFASAITASFIPIYNEYLVKRDRDEADGFAGNFITVMGMLSLILTVLGMIFAPYLTAFLADGYDAQTAQLCTELTQIMFPTVLFTGLAYSFVGIIQSMDEFNLPAAMSLVSNGIIIVYYFTLNDRFGVYGLAVTFLIAWLMQALIQVPYLARHGFKYRPSLKMRTEGMKKVFSLMLPVMVSTWVLPINQTINSKFGSRLFDGAGVSAIEFANNLYIIIAGVFVLSVTNFIFPRLSRMSSDSDDAAVSETVGGTLHASLYIVIPLMMGLIALSKPIVQFIYGGGEFDAFSAEITSRALMFVSMGMIGYTVQAVLCRVYFAEQNGRVPLIAGAVSIAVNIALCMVLTERFDVAGLGIASAVSCTVNAVLLAIPLAKKKTGMFKKEFFADMLKLCISAAVMTAIVAAASGFSAGIADGKAGELISILIPTAIGAAVYAVMTALFKVKETVMVLDFIKNRLGRRNDRA